MDSGKIDIVRLSENEIDDWLSLRGILWREIDDEAHLSEMKAILSEPEKQIAFGAFGDGRMQGFLEASIRPHVEGCSSDRIGYIEGWFVLPAFRRRGVGAGLVSAAENWARVNGCSEMASDSELGNEAGLRAHLRLGFTETGRLVHLRKDLA